MYNVERDKLNCVLEVTCECCTYIIGKTPEGNISLRMANTRNNLLPVNRRESHIGEIIIVQKKKKNWKRNEIK